MRALDAPTIAALSAPAVTLVQLVYMGFSTPIALNSSNWDLQWGTILYKGAGIGATTVAAGVAVTNYGGYVALYSGRRLVDVKGKGAVETWRLVGPRRLGRRAGDQLITSDA